MSENLYDGLKEELERNREILKMYEEIPQGAFGANLIRQAIEYGEAAISSGDVVSMIAAYQELEKTK